MVQPQALEDFAANQASDQRNAHQPVQFWGRHLAVHAVLKLDPQPWYREKDGGPRTLQVLHKGVQRFGKENASAVAQRCLLNQHPFGHMGQWQVGDVAVMHIHAHPPCGAGHAPGHGAVAVHHALGFAGGAGGVNDGADRIHLRCRLTCHGFVLGLQVGPCECLDGGRQRQGDQGHAAGHASLQVGGVVHFADKAGTRLAVLQDIGQRFAVKGGVDGDGDVACHLDGQVGQYPVRTVLSDDRYTAAFGPALRCQPGGRSAHLISRFAPGDVLHLTPTDGLSQVDLIGSLALPAVETLQRQVA